jgi:drug/metabolite transporter (DMT)-like permease
LAFLFQTLAQRRASPIHTAIILATEPAFASILSIGFGYEPFTLKLITGGVLMIVGMILSSTGESFKKLPGKII